MPNIEFPEIDYDTGAVLKQTCRWGLYGTVYTLNKICDLVYFVMGVCRAYLTTAQDKLDKAIKENRLRDPDNSGGLFSKAKQDRQVPETTHDKTSVSEQQADTDEKSESDQPSTGAVERTDESQSDMPNSETPEDCTEEFDKKEIEALEKQILETVPRS